MELEKIIKEAMKEREASPKQSDEKSFIDVLLANRDTYSESKLIAEAISVMVEGFHTSGYCEYLNPKSFCFSFDFSRESITQLIIRKLCY